MGQFNQIEYITKYNKEHYKQLKFYLTEEEYNMLQELKKKLKVKSYRELILYLIKKSG